jgi:hypothetical protein
MRWTERQQFRLAAKRQGNNAKNRVLTFCILVAVFWFVAQFSVVEVYRHFRGAFCLHHQGDEVPSCESLKSHCLIHVLTSKA